MLYPILQCMLISAIPAVYLFFFHKYKKASYLFRVILVALSSASVMIMTFYMNNMFPFLLLFLIVPLFIAGIYAGTSPLIITSVIVLFLQTILQVPIVFLIQFAVVFVISVIVNILYFETYHLASTTRKLQIIIRMNLISVIAIICSILMFDSGSVLYSSWAATAQLICFAIAQFLTMLATFVAIDKQLQLAKLETMYNELEEKSNRRIHWLLQAAQEVPHSVICVDRSGSIIYANKAAYVHYPDLKRTKDNRQLSGQHLGHIVSEKTQNMLTHSIQQALLSKNTVTITDFSEEKYTSYFVMPLQDYSNKETYVFSIFAQDITELHTLRSEVDHKDRLSLVGQMAAGITHEIRNPMAVIRGFVQLLQEKSTSLQQEYFRIIIDELDRANSIISDFLTLAQNKEVARQSHCINEIIHELAPLLMADANLRGQTVSFSLASNIPSIELNDREIKQLLLNLARNGMEAMGSSGHLEIYTYKLNQMIYLCIADTGPGIPDELKKKIFEPLYTSKPSGTGLGLSLCASIVKRYNGQVHLLNRETMGTIVQVTFPIEQQLMTS